MCEYFGSFLLFVFITVVDGGIDVSFSQCCRRRQRCRGLHELLLQVVMLLLLFLQPPPIVCPPPPPPLLSNGCFFPSTTTSSWGSVLRFFGFFVLRHPLIHVYTLSTAYLPTRCTYQYGTEKRRKALVLLNVSKMYAQLAFICLKCIHRLGVNKAFIGMHGVSSPILEIVLSLSMFLSYWLVV